MCTYNTSLSSGDHVPWSSIAPHPVTVTSSFSVIEFIGRQIVPTDEGKSEAELKYLDNLRRPMSFRIALQILIEKIFIKKWFVNFLSFFMSYSESQSG